MATGDRRESMIGMRATRTAVRVGSDLSHLPVDLEHVYCAGCQSELDWQHQTGVHYDIFCRACGTTTPLPCHLRSCIIFPRDVPIVRSESDTHFHGSFPPDPTPAYEDVPTPLWLKIFFVISIGAGAVLGAVVFIRAIFAAVK